MSNLSVSSAVTITSFSSLPPEMVIQIASFLTPKNIASLLTVNNDWYRSLSSNQLWSKFCLRVSLPEQLKDRFYLTCYPELSGISLIWSARRGEIRHLSTLWNMDGTVDCLRVTDKNVIAATFGSEKVIVLWDRSILQKEILEKYQGISAGQEISAKKCTFKVLPSDIMGFNVTDSSFIFATYRDGTLYLTACKDGNIDFKQPMIGHKSFVNSIEVCGKNVISAGQDGTIRIWNFNGEHQHILKGHQGPIECLQATEHMIFSGSRDKMIGIWDRIQNTPPKFLTGHEKAVTCLKVTGSLLISGSEDQTIRVWNRETLALKHIFKRHTDHIIGLEAIDNTLISYGKDDTLRIWDLSEGDLLNTFEIKGPLSMKIVESHLLIGCKDGGIQVWGHSKKE